MIRVLTLNLNYYVAKHGPWPARRALIEAAVASARPDVLAFQAVRCDPALHGGLDQAAQLAQRLGEYPDVVYRGTAGAGGSAEGSAVVSRLPVAATDYLALTLLPGLEDTNRRLVIHARLDLASGPLHVFNAHFSWVPEQTRLNVEQTLPYIRGADGPALLVGDLNAPADEDRLLPLREAGWADVWAALRPGEPGYTFESSAPTLRIDYAWASPALVERVRDIEIVAGEPGAGGARASDHLGLLVTLDL